MAESPYCIVYGKSAGLRDAEARVPRVHGLMSVVEERVADGFPLVVDVDGFPVEVFLAFFVSRIGLAASTSAQYAQALVRFAEFVNYRGAESVLGATSQDLTAYRLYRTQTAGAPIAEYSFRVEASALRQFYAWAVETGRLRRSPVKKLSRSGRDSLSTNRIRHSKIRHVDSYLYGELLAAAGGGRLMSSICSTSERDSAAIKTFTTTGLRLQELASLLTLDIDHGLALERSICVEMESITKFGINRNALIPLATVEGIHRYRKMERPNVVHRHQRSLKRQLDGCFVVSGFDLSTRRVSGTWKGRRRQYLLHRLPVEMRRKAVTVGVDDVVEPLCLFLSDSRGLGMTRSGWEGVFTAISGEMVRRNPDDKRIRKVTPHDLRHTFAINYLRSAHAVRAKRVAVSMLGDDPPLRDPLIDLQELLGHLTAAQTLRYLRYVEDIDRVVAAAVPDSEYGERDDAS
ncbi:tyrosine-type recombinase/integrase [Mycobacteroides abscessus subsp. abscessus]|uniref:tyrosine-type recombinase/integrase n=2 Tax=Mycobacteroides abscessus TaxID=36809 RepID=UPI000926D227|nr:site-specific integrase [Mycobacteroides abscessus]SLE26185.1 site-specific recombinase XerD [Mycobacteroides abscessus subsp. bolletii]MDO3091984.1 tyrosine-type recombinase/integrase [Mycobacteroides abscessus subsp. abscessus]PVB55024.1 integrase [Mycobacteroides abscessus]RIR73860.1 integrase [Mycobacteroides abscessus]SHX52621.1 site-specific recombinase XerD [Mycobacteroides abscessus subsp. abscessus]